VCISGQDIIALDALQPNQLVAVFMVNVHLKAQARTGGSALMKINIRADADTWVKVKDELGSWTETKWVVKTAKNLKCGDKGSNCWNVTIRSENNLGESGIITYSVADKPDGYWSIRGEKVRVKKDKEIPV
jgi:hypothetical protein